MSQLTIRDCQLGNVTCAHVKVEAGAMVGACIEDNLFDNTTLVNPPNGLLLNCTGFSVRGNAFGGSTELSCPTTMYVVLNGEGEFTGNTMLSAYPGVEITFGCVHFAGNYLAGDPPLTITGGMVAGGGNTYVPTRPNGSGGVKNASPGVSVVSTSAACVLDLGPDQFLAAAGGSYAGHSYDVAPAGGSQLTRGRVRYDPLYDQSASGPTSSTPFVRLINIGLNDYSSPICPVNGGVGGFALLDTYAIPANCLDQQGKGIRFHAWGTVNVTSTVGVEVAFGGTVFYSTGNVTATAGTWELHGTVYRGNSSSVQYACAGGYFNGAAIPPAIQEMNADLTAEQTLTILGGSNDAAAHCVLYGFDVEVAQ